MGTSLNVKNDDTCRLAGELARLTGRKDTILNTLHPRLKNLFTQIMIFVLLLVCSVPSVGKSPTRCRRKGRHRRRQSAPGGRDGCRGQRIATAGRPYT